MSRASSRRRTALTLLTVLVFAVFIVVKLVDIQVVRAATLDAAAEGKRGVEETVQSTRGDIVDSDGTVLATTSMLYDVKTAPSLWTARTQWTDPNGEVKTISRAQAAEEMGSVLGVTGASILKTIDDALAIDPDSNFAYVAKDITLSQLNKLKKMGFAWLSYDQSPQRVYPNGSVAGNLIGFLGADETPLAGLELQDDKCLAGTDGTTTYSRGEDGTMIPGTEVVEKPVENGGTLKLTIDDDLQWFTQQTLQTQVKATGAQWGMVVVESVKTGKILAAADSDTVDPNDPSASSAANRGARVFTAAYEPGSVMKPVTASALIDTGRGTPTSHVLAPYSYTATNGATFRDSEYHAPEKLTLAGVLKESSNTGISILGQKVPAKTRYAYLRKFGFGAATAVHFAGETTGILKNYKDWDNQTDYTTMFGQGVSASIMQLAGEYQTIGNDGVRLPTKLVDSCTAADGTVTDTTTGKGVRVEKASTSKKIVKMMEGVYREGFAADALKIPGYNIGAKTGTGEYQLANGTYSAGSYNATVAGLAPAEDPQYVVIAMLHAPTKTTSSLATAPLFHDIMSQVLKTYDVTPSTKEDSLYPMTY